MHNLGTVFTFEVTRTLKKKSFWLLALSFPLLMAVIFGIVYASNTATDKAVEDMQKQKFSAVVLDQSGLVKPELLSAMGLKTVDDKQAGIDMVKTGTVDGFFYYPADLTKNKVETYGKNISIFDNGRYDAVSSALLNQSIGSNVSPNVRAVLSKSVKTEGKFYKDGEAYDPMMQMIAPGFFLVLFYFLIAMFGNQALSSTTEEKENRVIEMILTTIEARTLIIGKILSLIVLAFVQALIFALPVVVAYLFFRTQLSLPSLDLSSIPLDPMRIGAALIIFAASFMLFMGLLVAIGAATPTAKEAGGFIGVVMMLLFGPLYAAPLFFSAPGSSIVTFLTYFPLTAPIPLLIRNAAGNIGWSEILLATAILILAAAFVIRTAIHAFRYGALEYSRKLSLKEIFGHR